MKPVSTTTAVQLRQRLDAGETPVLLDVREDWEVALCRIDGSLHLPMGRIPARLDEIPADRPVVCLCHHGMRSAQVAAFLANNGFSDVENLDGGIDAWSLHVDPAVPRY